MHGFIYPTDYTDNNLKGIGMLNIINSFNKDENTLIIDGGYTIQGSPFTTYISKCDIEDTLSCVKKTYDEVKKKVDILIGVYHGGFERDLETNDILSTIKENLGYKICEDFDFDILLTGHQHMPISGRILNNTYIAQTPANGQGFIELNLKYDDKIIEINSSLNVPEINPNKKIAEELMTFENKVQVWLDSPVGHLDIPLNPTSHLEMALNGSALANFDDDILTLAMNNYRASGSGSYEFFKECKIVKEIQSEMTEIIIEYFENNKDIVVDKKKYINIIK